jgi:hypothetical protein
MFTLPVTAPDATSAPPFKPAAPTFAVVLTVSLVEYPIHANIDSTHSVNLPKLKRLNIKTQIINTINIPDIIDQMLYPDSVPESATESEPAAPVIVDVKEFNEFVNGAVIDSAAVDDDSAGKLILLLFIVVIYYYYLLLLLLLFIIIKK